jgi:serine/threonine protein kinase
MPRYDCNFRDVISRVAPKETLDYFMQILEGIEAAHLQKVVHRDLKPENILFDRNRTILAIADFGIARFEEDFLITPVATAPQQRLANFRYAAPEQRSGQNIGIPTDVYALGLILNESFTGETPVGTDYRTISSVAETFGYLDEIVSAMIRQSPANRPSSIFEIKTRIKNANREIAHRQKISKIDSAVVPDNTIDDVLAIKPPIITDATWASGQLEVTFDCNISDGWISGLCRMEEGYGSITGAGPQQFHFVGNKAQVRCSGAQAQHIINYLKDWLPKATRTYKRILERQFLEKKQQESDKLHAQRAIEEEHFRINGALRI